MKNINITRILNRIKTIQENPIVLHNTESLSDIEPVVFKKTSDEVKINLGKNDKRVIETPSVDMKINTQVNDQNFVKVVKQPLKLSRLFKRMK